MNKCNIQLLVTEEEFKKLKTEADKNGLTVPLYIKSKVLPENDLTAYYEILLEKVKNIPSGTKFTIKALFGVEWTMSRGIRLNLGKSYYKYVEKGNTDAKVIGKDTSNIMWYEKL